MADRAKLLVFEGADHQTGEAIAQRFPEYDVVRVDGLDQGLGLLQTEHFDALYINTDASEIWEGAEPLFRSYYLFRTIDEGIAVVDPDLTITWFNPALERICTGEIKGRSFYDALGSPEILGPDYCPFHTALTGRAVTTRLHLSDNRYFELRVTPIADSQGKIRQMMALMRDVTAEVQRQQKLDALHQAGRELAALPTDQLAQMSVEERIELLKANILRFTHDLLHYSQVEIRLLDKKTNRLEPLLQEGLTEEAANRVLYAKVEGNGITGYVAATGKSYLCPDTAQDPLYLEGTRGARSSITVPLIVGEEVIGTFNVESPVPDSFDEQDLQFLEIFSREVALALHTLELLTAEKRSTTEQSVLAISREVALPVDNILHAASALLERWIGHEPEVEEQLREILDNARAIKEVIRKVGEDLTPAMPAVRSEPVHPNLKGKRILVADADERVRRSAHTILGGLGCIVETARDGKEALMMARLSDYDAILADIRLPDLPGYEAYKKLREVQPHAQVILMTGYGYDPAHSIVKARREGLQHVLFKPFRVNQLIEALENTNGQLSKKSQSEPTMIRI